MNLRDQIAKDISRAIDSSVNYGGDEYEQNRHNWVQITTDRAIAAFVSSLPEPIDIESKYELTDPRGPAITIHSEEDEEANHEQLVYLARYADDRGYNRYYTEMMAYLQALYNAPQPVIQSENEQHRLHGTSEGDSPPDKEPSKVR